MSWTTFVLAYAALMALALLLGRRAFRGGGRALARTLVFGACLLALADILAEQRGLWFIPRPSGLYLLASPVENLLLIVAALLNSLIPYVLLRGRSQSE